MRWMLLWCCTTPLCLAAAGGNPTAHAALRILQAECFSCHGETKQKGGLSLLSRESILRGGDEGPAAVPGRPDQSRLVTFLKEGADPHMPPRKQLEPAQIRVLRDWVKRGMVWDSSALQEEEPPAVLELAPWPAELQPVLALAWSPDGSRLAVGRGRLLTVHDVSATNAMTIHEVTAHPEAVQSLAWSPDGRWIVSGGFRRVRFWSSEGLQPGREITQGLRGRVTALTFSPDGSTLVAADGGNGRAGYLRLWGGTDASGPMRSWKVHADTVFGIAYSRDGSRLVTAGGDQLVKVWDPETRTEVAVLEGHTAQVLGVAFNTNATRVVSGGADRQLKVWDIATREKIVTLGNSSAAWNAVAWPGEGAALFAATDSGAVYRYTQLKSHTGEQSSATAEERHLGNLPDSAPLLAATPDGRRVAVGGQTGLVRIWDAEGAQVAEIPPAIPERTEPPAAPQAGTRTTKSPKARSGKWSPRRIPAASQPIRSLSAEPAALELSADSPRHAVIVTAELLDGLTVDVTEAVRFEVSRRAPFRVDVTGAVVAERPGTGELTARWAGRAVKIPVTVRGDPSRTPTPSFVRDVLPRLNQAGCASGGCHSKPEGQNGFKLSVFSYDPKADFGELVREGRGRRTFPPAPEESLLVQKPLNTVPHEGGQRFARDSETHRILVRWQQAGMPYAAAEEPVLQRITAFPAERRYAKGSTQRLLIRAHYSDGGVRDVTALAAFESNDGEVARVDSAGRMTVGSQTGQAVVVARYMGFVAAAQVLVPAETLLPMERYAALPKHNFVDELSDAQWQRLGLFPSPLCSDAEFLRRSKLDTLGLLPTPEEVRTFLSDPDPDKRRRWIGHLLEHPAYADYWANKWADLLRPNPDRVGVKSVFLLDQWIREQFRANRPYDEFAREIVLAEGSNHRAGPAVIYRDRREPPELTTLFSQLFLGTRLECAKCHHHPNEKWSQDDFYQLAAYFGPVKQKGAGLSPPISAGTETFYYAPGGAVKHPVSGAVMTPRSPDGPEPRESPGDPRRALADWMTQPENPFFAPAAVNRVWANFFGRGLVHPVDDFRTSNPCVNPELLAALARDFAVHGYDLKHLMRILLESRTYQLSTEPNDTNLSDTRQFSRSYRRRLPAEVLMDAVRDVTGVPDIFAALPAGGRAMQVWSYKVESHFLDAFGRPNPSSDCPCERDLQLSVVQSLHLMNSRSVQAKLSDPQGRVRRLAAGDQPPEEVVREAYLTTLNREPSPRELQLAVAAFAAAGSTREMATEDVFWALLNSPEFILNH